MEVYLKLNKE